MEEHNKKKVVIIGGGISGLSAGVYALKSGFNVTILESRGTPGGCCTSWERNGYLFEGAMHWLSGSSPKEQLNALWRQVGALNDNVRIDYHEPFIEYDHKGTPIRLYRNIDTTRRHLLEISPADAKEIKKMCAYISTVKNLAIPITDLCGVKVKKRIYPPLKLLFSALFALRMLICFSKISREQYINRFTHEGIRDLLGSCISNRSSILSMFLTMGILARGDGGFPEGGSLHFVERMVKTFIELGGEILYNTKTDRVIVENGMAAGVVAGERRLSASAVIITVDTMTIDSLFEIPPKAPWLDKMHKVTGPKMVTFISLGIDADLRKYPRNIAFKLKQPIKLAEQIYEYLSVRNYADDPMYSPAGKTAITIQLSGDTYDFWKKAKEENRYKEEKQKIANEVISALTAHIPVIDGQIEVIDVATPLTYERYCASWKGSWMTAMKHGMKAGVYPSVVKGLSGVYFAGHRMIPPGGLPVALMSGRTAVQYLCRNTGTVFIT